MNRLAFVWDLDRARLRLSAAIAALALCGCGTDASSRSSSPDSFIDSFVEHTCSAKQRCGEAVFDHDSCIAINVAGYEDGSLGFLLSQVDAGKIVYDSKQAAACIAAVDETTCYDDETVWPTCEDVFAGKGRDGDSCVIDGQCEGKSFCDKGERCPGVCRARAGQGESCVNTACERGSYCFDDVCTERLPRGAACSSSTASCMLGLDCLDEEGATLADEREAGTCMPRPNRQTGTLGDTCAHPGEQGVRCGPGLACVPSEDRSSSTCKVRIARGEACRAGYPNACEPDAYCTGTFNDGDGNGTCAALPQAGEPCTQRGDFQCAFGLECDSSDNRCRAAARIGEACADASACASHHCKDNVCVELAHCDP